MRATIISAADAEYFDFLLDLIGSIRRLPESGTVDLCILDVGLTADQIAILAPLVTRIVPSRWDLDFPNRAQSPYWFKAVTCRPHLPQYFPDYEILIWIDADAWLCNWDSVGLLLQAGRKYGFAAVPELDRSYSTCYHLRPGVIENVRDTYTEAFGAEAAQRYTFMPLINSGVFAMRSNSPYWQIWSEILAQALQRSSRFIVEQCSLNVGIYTGRIQAHFLPSWCNWICSNALPVLNLPTGDLFSPMIPHERISICHLVDVKRDEREVPCTDGTTRRMPLTYRAVRAAMVPHAKT